MLTLRDQIEELFLDLEKKGTDLVADKVRLDTFDLMLKKKMKKVLKKLNASINPLPYRKERGICKDY